jgi:hypothetical protein
MKKLWERFKQTSFYLTHKEELVIIPVLLMVFIFVNLALSWIFPH